MTSLEGPPPHRHISTTPISLSAGSRMLEAYLAHSEAHPHLHPDALITPTGVTFSSHGGPMGGVVMHNLRRVAAGLRGEYLEPEATPEPEADADVVADGAGAQKKARKVGRAGAEEGWQDMARYEESQGMIQVGDLGERSNALQDGGEAPEIEATGGDGKRKIEDGEGGKMDKEARKKAKKARDAERKRDNEKKRAENAE
ncbi:hypothetical protein P153DRAFT_372709 [Dothidotthia symphoricarpi CBS 119687]|uniref:Uncharacterized protein n=1 Tax=Dothidotthia symphoricarpi CBS 119687 TaxID=1392245 RepID=A0A6A6AR26_9PLEO|nr:uncharacterized protein P153DRAFT_372709 [Dothidotthia symphoricarpi CBS 119687]KAF2134260.1 hypothetical protein P153DRAFT_372709 [Dothidotthia symphoricarpi CBS 119687]